MLVFLRYLLCVTVLLLFFFFNDTATTEIYTLSLHDALPILALIIISILGPGLANAMIAVGIGEAPAYTRVVRSAALGVDRKSTRLNSSHTVISYAVFCLKKKKKKDHLLLLHLNVFRHVIVMH